VARVNGTKIEESRRLLVERVAASRHFSKSARLRDLLVFLCEHGVDGEVHEQEVGHKVFGRPADYDTSSDNIVRVHASMLRKRLDQFFAEDGAGEPVIVEIPRGNYAPVFREREVEAAPAAAPAEKERDWRVPALAGLAAVFAISTAVLLLRTANPAAGPVAQRGPTVQRFWGQVYRGGQAADIVLDDAALGLYQELAGRNLALSDYFDRSYMRGVEDAGQSAIVLRRQSSYANANFLWKMFQLVGPLAAKTNVVFARDYTFHALKGDNAILLGNLRSNPWMEPFLAHTGLRWQYDKAAGTYFPVDTWAGTEAKAFRNPDSQEGREGYCAITLLPNLGGTGNVLMLTATGGSAFNAAADFLGDESAMARLRQGLPATKDGTFPYFEALVRVKGRSSLARDSVVAVCRVTRG
jgi:hypothetical protein